MEDWDDEDYEEEGGSFEWWRLAIILLWTAGLVLPFVLYFLSQK
jgi:hypothetical protein